MRTLELPAGKSAREWGRIHGESFRGEIATLATLRTYLCTKVGSFMTAEHVTLAARAHLPILERYDADLHAELLGIAEGAGVTPEDIVVANHYTDLRDLDPDPATWTPAPTSDTVPPHEHVHGHHHDHTDGCSTMWAESPTGRILAQTWDMHATAIPYVMTLRVPETARGPAATLMTVTGCLGMTGMNGKRVAIAINNLYSTDATLGVVWPAMVRKALLKSPTPIPPPKTTKTEPPVTAIAFAVIKDLASTNKGSPADKAARINRLIPNAINTTTVNATPAVPLKTNKATKNRFALRARFA